MGKKKSLGLLKTPFLEIKESLFEITKGGQMPDPLGAHLDILQRRRKRK